MGIEDCEDQEWRNKSKGKNGKRKWENQRSETEIVRPCGEKDRGRCSNENMEDGNIGRPKLRWSETLLEWMRKQHKTRKHKELKHDGTTSNQWIIDNIATDERQTYLDRVVDSAP